MPESKKPSKTKADKPKARTPKPAATEEQSPQVMAEAAPETPQIVAEPVVAETMAKRAAAPKPEKKTTAAKKGRAPPLSPHQLHRLRTSRSAATTLSRSKSSRRKGARPFTRELRMFFPRSTT